MPGGWASALGEAILRGNQGYQQGVQLQQQKKTNDFENQQRALQLAILKNQVAEIPKQSAMDDVKNLLSLQGDAAYNNPAFGSAAKQAGLNLPTKDITKARVGAVEDNQPLLGAITGPNATPNAPAMDNGQMARHLGVAPDTGLVLPEKWQLEKTTNPLTGGQNLQRVDVQRGMSEPLNGSEPQSPLMGTASGDAALQGVDPKIANVVKLVANYKLQLPSGMALRTPYWQNILQLTAAYDPTFDQTQYGSRQKLRSDFTSGKGAQAIRSINQVVHHIDTLRQAGDALNNKSMPAYNSAANWVVSQAGDPRVNNFNLAATAVQNELANVFKNTGATDQEIKQWRATIDAAQSPDQLKGVVSEAIKLLEGRIAAVNDQWSGGMGKPTDFKILSPETEKLLGSLGGHVSTPAESPKAQEAAPSEMSVGDVEGGARGPSVAPPAAAAKPVAQTAQPVAAPQQQAPGVKPGDTLTLAQVSAKIKGTNITLKDAVQRLQASGVKVVGGDQQAAPAAPAPPPQQAFQKATRITAAPQPAPWTIDSFLHNIGIR